MAKTLGQMRGEIWRWTDTNTVRFPEDDLTSIINDVIEDISTSADFSYNEFEEEITTTAGVDYVLLSSLTNVFSHPFSMWYTHEGMRVRVEYLPLEEFEQLYKDTTKTDRPQNYTLFGGKILFGPTPDAAYSIDFKFYGRPGDMELDADTNGFLVNAWHVVRYGVMTEACKYLIEDNRVPLFENSFERRKRRFIIDHARANTSGHRSASKEPGYLES
jgi:hypothetical protein